MAATLVRYKFIRKLNKQLIHWLRDGVTLEAVYYIYIRVNKQVKATDYLSRHVATPARKSKVLSWDMGQDHIQRNRRDLRKLDQYRRSTTWPLPYAEKKELVRFEKGFVDGRSRAVNVKKLHVSQQKIICTVSQILHGFEETARGKFAEETFDPGEWLILKGKDIEDYPIQELRDILRLMPQPPCMRQITLDERLKDWKKNSCRF